MADDKQSLKFSQSSNHKQKAQEDFAKQISGDREDEKLVNKQKHQSED